MNINSIKNFFLKDTILDWLNLHGYPKYKSQIISNNCLSRFNPSTLICSSDFNFAKIELKICLFISENNLIFSSK